jgi:hypothetical protein
MGTVAFFPWLRLQRPVTVDTVRLVPFRRGRDPGGTGTQLQQTLDSLLEPYHAVIARPVEEATIISLRGQPPTEPIRDDTLPELFLVAELVAFSALAIRPFFHPLSMGYVNRDLFGLVVQNFDDPKGGVSLTTRRRDGTGQTHVTRDAYRVDRPRHVWAPWPIELDELLLRALMNIRGTDEGRFLESVVLFNRANTDRSDIGEETELILTAGAFQRLLLCRSKEHELARKFTRVFAPSMTVPFDAPSTLAPLKRPRKPGGWSVREAWVRDLYATRGDVAHGATKPRRDSAWSLADHLLLSAYAFPRLLKLCLSEGGAYALTDVDRFDIDVFEDLARHELSRCTVGDDGEEQWPWNTIRMHWARHRRRRSSARPE